MKLKAPVLPESVLDDFLNITTPEKCEAFRVATVRPARDIFHREISDARMMSHAMALRWRVGDANNARETAKIQIKENPGSRAAVLTRLTTYLEGLCRPIEADTALYSPLFRTKTVRRGLQLETEIHFDSVWSWLTMLALLRIKGQKVCGDCGTVIDVNEKGRPSEYCETCKTRQSRRRRHVRKVSGNEN